MTQPQKHILLLMVGVLLLALTFFQEPTFVTSGTGLWLYRLCAMGGLLLTAGALGRLVGRRTMWALLAATVLAEIGLALLFRAVVLGVGLPPKLTDLLGYIYLNRCRDYVVYDDDRGRWDEDLFYTLKPGDFEYSNAEFSTTYHVNSLGLRDDEASLDHPEIIFLGDSYTMGWGVEQEGNFTQILEKQLGKRALTAGIASYGTAREYLTWQRLQTDSCRLLVLQFCPNDVQENRSFVENGFRLEVSPPKVFRKEVNWNKLFQVYYPLKYVHSALFFLVEKMKPAPPALPEDTGAVTDGISEQGVEDFFRILQKIREGYDGSIVVFHLGMGITQPRVTEQFRAWLAANPAMAGVHVFPTAEHLGKEDYLPLDTHLTLGGNHRLAEALERFFLEIGN